MKIICTYCGSECGEREQQNGRCGSCACFFVGTEVVVQEEDASLGNAPTSDTGHPAVDSDPAIEPPPAPPKPPPIVAPKSELGALLESMMPEANQLLGGFNPDSVEPDLPMMGMEASEGLIQPRKLSPQYQKRVERTWQSTFGGGAFSAEHTLNSASPSMGTKKDCPTLSIATRKISRAEDGDRRDIDGDYELKEVIGEGSMGRVWSARQTSLDRNVAVKVPMAELAGSGSVGESQFISEVVVTGQLEHPNIVPIYELGRDANGLPFYSMKHVQGQAWNESIADKTTAENIEILMKVCDAIAFAHDRNFLHRDIKPHNVMVGEFGEVSVMDWGIAVAVQRDPTKPWASVATGPAGTPAYMAPEMAAHNPSELGAVSDIYLLGAVLYEIVTGTPPHPKTGDTRAALLAAAANEIIPTTKTGELVDIARRAMATNLEDRYQTVKEFQDAIREYQSHRESIKLSESAKQHYQSAAENHSSDEYARSRFAYEEALRLWDGNHSARQGLKVATLAHAKNALDQENFELGISILDASDPSHRDLLNKLESSRAQRRRLAAVSKIAAATAAIAVFAVVGVTFYSYGELKDSAAKLETEKEVAVQERQNAMQSEEAAIAAADLAKEAERKAKLAERVALVAKNEARGAEVVARQEKRRAEEAAYASEIGLAAESIRRNDFEKAERILDKMDPLSGQPFNAVMSRLRHLEWGILRDASAPSSMQKLLTDVHVDSVTSSVDGHIFAAGADSGNVYLWTKSTDEQLGEPVVVNFGRSVTSVALSDDGSKLAVAGIRNNQIDNGEKDQTSENTYAISVWEIKDGNVAATPIILPGHQATVLSLSFSKDGQRLVSGASDRKAIVWNSVDGTTISVMRDHLEKEVYDARFSPDASQVVTSCEDGRVRVWSLNTNSSEAKKVHDLRGHDGPVYCATFTPDGQSIISGGYDRKLLSWSLNTASGRPNDLSNRLIAQASEQSSQSAASTQIGSDEEQHEASIHAIAIGQIDGHDCLLSGGNDNTIRVWNFDRQAWSLDKVLRGHGRWVRSCVFSDNGRTVVSGAFDGVKRWNWNAYELPRDLFPVAERRLGKRPSEIGLSAVSNSIYSPDGRWVASSYSNGNVAVWDLAADDRSESQLLGEGHALLTATGQFFDSDSQLLTSAGDNTTRLWDVQRGSQTAVLSGTGYRGVASIVCQQANGDFLVATGSDNRLIPAKLWSVQADGQISHLPLLQDQAVKSIEVGPIAGANRSTTHLTSSTVDDEQFRQYRQRVRRIPDVTKISSSPDGRKFIIGDASGRCYVYATPVNSSDPELISSVSIHGTPITDLVILPDNSTAISASEDGRIRQWQLDDGQVIGEVPWAGPVTDLDLSEDGTRLIVGHAPVIGQDYPIAEVFTIDSDGRFSSNCQLNSTEPSTRTTKTIRPTVQSVKFSRDDQTALLSLYFPEQVENGNRIGESSSGYRMALWNASNNGQEIEWIQNGENGEIASALTTSNNRKSQLLVVGGKGARLWDRQDSDPTRFTKLVHSFRPIAAITSTSFSHDPTANRSEQLLIGDSEGNLKVWQLNDNQWDESSGVAQSLAGHHESEIIASQFHPLDPTRFISVDRLGAWHQWQLDESQQWQIVQSGKFTDDSSTCFVAMFSPDGQSVAVGTDSGGQLWKFDDNGQIQKSAQPWESGPVRNLVFSHDNQLIVTTDSDRNVCFWDMQSKLLARLNEDDALSVSTMDLSKDRRRFVTGQGKRVVIWDTSRIDPSNSAQTMVNIPELLSLEEHRAVTSVSLSPDGKNLLSAGSEGRTVIWNGKTIAPVTMTGSSTQILYRIGSKPARLDGSIIINDPCNLLRYDNARIHVSTTTLDGDEDLQRDLRERLVIAPAANDGFTIDRAKGDVFYQAYAGAPRQLVASIQSANRPSEGFDNPAKDVDNHAELVVQLSPQITSNIVERLLGTIHYSVDSTELATVDQSFDPAKKETTKSNAVNSRKIKIRIDSLGYRQVEQSSLPSTNARLFPSALESVIEIDIETTGTQDASPLEGQVAQLHIAK
ncbi:protein kinase [Stieleria sp. JC731]|uniref:protein kinase domain-containing protein n=1 Tax=Pirellulaceae TaxID=2691357 RepID=UPI001E3D648C|nr:protein kinase [Stieleria sp. JC731]MCC9603440.1 protein kinase [Stieleria sp. JC731]